MKQTGLILFIICLLLGITVKVSASDTVDARIEVSATDACSVCLEGVSENTEGYREIKMVTGQAAYVISYTEPGEYVYELKQVKDSAGEIYDDTVYQVFVTVVYDKGVMTAVVTGAVKGTDDKPERFEFQKPPVPTPPEQGNDPRTGDASASVFWTELFCAGAFCIFLVLFLAWNRKRAEKKKDERGS